MVYIPWRGEIVFTEYSTGRGGPAGRAVTGTLTIPWDWQSIGIMKAVSRCQEPQQLSPSEVANIPKPLPRPKPQNVNLGPSLSGDRPGSGASPPTRGFFKFRGPGGRGVGVGFSQAPPPSRGGGGRPSGYPPEVGFASFFGAKHR